MKKYISLLSLALVFMLTACSGKSDTNNQKENNGQQTTAQANTKTHAITVYGIDKLKFVVAEQNQGLQTGDEVTIDGKTFYLLKGITADAGQELTITLKTISKLPATAMSHNWLMLTQGTNAEAFVNASVKAKDNDYVAEDMMDNVIKETGLVANGESKSITFKVPKQTGDYTYICTFPGHYSAGMKGTLTVE